MSGPAIGRPLWRCPSCGRTFANLHQAHTCRPLGDLDVHFAGCEPQVRATFDRVLSVLRGIGPFTVLPERTRIAFHLRMSFAVFMARQRWLTGHLILDRQVDSARFRRVEVYSPRNVLHVFRLQAPDDVDEEFAAWLAQAYAVGAQLHLHR